MQLAQDHNFKEFVAEARYVLGLLISPRRMAYASLSFAFAQHGVDSPGFDAPRISGDCGRTVRRMGV